MKIDSYNLLYNENGNFFLEEYNTHFYNEDFSNLESDLNRAVERVLQEHIELFNETVIITEKKYLEASNQIMNAIKNEFAILTSLVKSKGSTKVVKNKLLKFSISLSKKILKIQEFIDNEQWDKAVRYTLGTKDISNIMGISSVVSAIAIGSNVSGYVKGKIKKHKRNKRKKEIESLKKNKKYFSAFKKQMSLTKDDIKEKYIKKSANNFINKYKNKLTVLAIGSAAGAVAGVSIMKYVTSKKVAQLDTVKIQIKKYLELLIKLNSETKKMI